MNRRNVLHWAGAMALSPATGSWPGAIGAVPTRRPAIGVQLYMVRDLLARDLDGTCAMP